MSDLRYTATGLLLKKGDIKFSDIYKHIPPSVIRQVIKATYQRMKILQENPKMWRVFEIDLLAEKMEVKAELLFVALDKEIKGSVM